jgi:hypothetical protein
MIASGAKPPAKSLRYFLFWVNLRGLLMVDWGRLPELMPLSLDAEGDSPPVKRNRLGR